ncbi:MAG TPA: heparinase, partial [Burkholderiaceae bacterium]|nr:heparinase [Burkholderiaceae bacterium]
MAKLAWKINRLRTMAPAEVAWRLRQALQARFEKHGIGLLRRPPAAHGASAQVWLGSMPVNLDVRPYRQAADRILSGRFDMFALRGIELGFPPHWQRDPKTGTVAPQAFG